MNFRPTLRQKYRKLNTSKISFFYRKLAVKQYEKHNGIDRQNLKMPGHIDISNHRFDVEDLKKLIKSTTNDLEEADKKRREPNKIKIWTK